MEISKFQGVEIMGMYSYVQNQEIYVTNPDGLKQYVMMCRNGDLYDGKLKHFVDCWVKTEFQCDNNSEKLTMEDDFLAEELDIDGWKIIQYWYDAFVTMIDDLSAFIEGHILLEAETEDEQAVITFQKSGVHIRIGTMKWSEPDLISQDRVVPDIIKKARLLRDI